MNRKKVNISIPLFLGLLFIASCSTTKFVPDDKYLLESVDIKVQPKKVKKEELEDYLQQLPNRKILNSYKFHLRVYNFSKRGRQGRFRQWTERVIGEPPVIYDQYLTDKTKSQFIQFLENKGYYHASVQDSIDIRKKKLYLLYNVELNNPYRINDIEYNISDTLLKNIIDADSANIVLEKEDIFDVSKLQTERNRIAQLLQNEGYYYLTKDYVYFTIDSNLNNNKVNVQISISNFKRRSFDNQIIEENHKKYKIQEIVIYPNFDSKEDLRVGEAYINSLDSLYFNDILYRYDKEINLKPEVIFNTLTIKESNTYSFEKVESSKRFLRLLKYYSLINIEFTEIPGIDEEGYGQLYCEIKLSPFIQQSYSLELEGTSSSANIGFGGNVNYEHKNLFKGAQIFDIGFSGGLQSQRGIAQSTDNFNFNTVEYGVQADLSIPRFLLPISSDRLFKKYRPRTLFSLSYNYQRRPDYTRLIANFDFGYDWNISQTVRNVLNPIDINFVDIPAKTAEFDSIISGTYLENSYKPFFISGASNTIIVSDNSINDNKRSFLWISNLKIAGNLQQLYYTATDQEKTGDAYTLFNDNQFAQFFKVDSDYRRYKFIDENNSFVFRFYSGIGIPYGNSNVLPFIEQFYGGGANGIRAWQVRDLGPGTYSYADSINYYPNQLGDFKLEMNLEYRFDMFWLIEGALFLDAGNIWNISREDERDEALFKFNRFYKEIAVGTGFGTRLDFSFFVFRVDFGVKLINPALENRWALEGGKIEYEDWMLNVGIGYPF